MKIWLGYLRISITISVIFFAVSARASFSKDIKTQTKQPLSFVSVSKSGLPAKNSNDENAPRFTATASIGNQPSTYHIRLNQQVVIPFRTLYKELLINKYHLGETTTFYSFLISLFRVIISPNAP